MSMKYFLNEFIADKKVVTQKDSARIQLVSKNIQLGSARLSSVPKAYQLGSARKNPARLSSAQLAKFQLGCNTNTRVIQKIQTFQTIDITIKKQQNLIL